MAEPAHPYGLPQALSPPKDIKEEVQHILDGLDFSMPNDNDMMATATAEPSNNLNEPVGQRDIQPQEQSISQGPQQSNGLAHDAESANQSSQSKGSPQAQKRQLEDGAPRQESEPKRVKTETGPEAEAEPSFEDGLALLVQNALDSANNMMDESHVDESRGEAELSAQNHDRFPEADPIAYVEATPAPATSLMPPSVSFTEEPERFVRTVNVRALGNLSLSLLLILCQELSEETMPKIRDFSSGHAGAFLQLRVSFEAVRGLVSRETSISADELGIDDADSRRILDFANMARLAIWLVEGGSKYLAELDKNFLSLFGTQISDLPPGMSHLYMEIKTQRVLDAIAAKDPNRKPEDITKEIFVDGLEEKLKAQHDSTELTEADKEFLKDAKARQEELVTHATNSTHNLKEKYPSEALLRTFSTYIKGRLAACSDLGIKLGIALPTAEEVGAEENQTQDPDPADDMDLDDLSSFFEKTTSGLVQSALAGFNTETKEATENPADQSNGDVQMNGTDDYMSDYKALEALVAESTSNYVRTTLDGLTPAPYQPTVPQSTAEAMAAPNNQPHYLEYNNQQAPDQYYSYAQQPIQEAQPQSQPQGPPGTNLPPNQTFPSAILYDKARQAALSKTSQHTRREGLHSTRRPWTQEEEKALMAGLDMVKGPHWSQILTLFGANGTISDILKDRTQVQLKDKARNLKLFFLKTNSEMPYYLQAVTGELKTRAPTQAARKEAEERARLNSEEDQAKLQGIMALAGGLQHPPQNRPSASPAKTIMQNVVTPAQAASAAAHAAAQRNKVATQGATSGAASNGVATANAARSVGAGTQHHTQSATHNNIRPQGQGLPATRPPIHQAAPGAQGHAQQPPPVHAPAVIQTSGQPKPQTHQTAEARPQGQTQSQAHAQTQNPPPAQPQSSTGQQPVNPPAQVQEAQPGVTTPRTVSNQPSSTPASASGQTTASTLPLPAPPTTQPDAQQHQQFGQTQAQAHSDNNQQDGPVQAAQQPLQPASAPPQTAQHESQQQPQQQPRSSPSTSAPAQPNPATQVQQQSHQTQTSPPAQSNSAAQPQTTPKQSQSQAGQTADRSSLPGVPLQQQQAPTQSPLTTSSTQAPPSIPSTTSEPPPKDRVAQPEAHTETNEDEDSSEATLLKGLQAAIAEATS